MKRRLQRIYWTGILITMLMAASAMGLMVEMKIDDTRENLRSILQAASAWTLESTEGLQSLAENIASVSPPLRVTFLMNQGLVLADSEADSLNMENHLNRPEVQAALAGGIGESLRPSDTQATFTLYAAMRISPLLILRLSYPLSEIMGLLLYYGLGLAALFLILFILQRRALSRFAGDMLRQMDEVRVLLEGDATHTQAVFPEFQPAVHNIAYLAQRLNDDLREVSRTLNLRNDFVANASHELRSPLTSIMGFAEMLDEGLADTPEEREMCLRLIRNECQRMLDVIQDILHLSRAEARTEQEAEPLAVAPLAQEICQSLAPQAAQKGIELSVEGEATVRAAEKDVWEVLYNLADNALRYGKQGGHVRILLDDAALTVEDDGIGIAPEHIPHLFEQFYRVDVARGMATGGTGLGLSIVRAIVERNGGEIHVESKPGEGSRFIVRFAREAESTGEVAE